MRRFFSSECMRRGGVVLGFVSAAAGAGKRLLIGIRNNTRPRVSFQHGQGSRKCRGGQIRTLTFILRKVKFLRAFTEPETPFSGEPLRPPVQSVSTANQPECRKRTIETSGTD